MSKSISISDIYNILIQKADEVITMDKICLKIKCSKKSLYKHFSSKNAMHIEIFNLYIVRIKNLFKNISELKKEAKYKLIFQIKTLHKQSKIFYESYLFNELKKLEEFD